MKSVYQSFMTLLLFISVTVIVSGGVFYFVNYRKQEKIDPQLLKIERQIDEVNKFYTIHLQSLSDKMGYQLYKSKFDLQNYDQSKKNTDQQRVLLKSLLDDPDDKRILGQIDSAVSKKFQLLDKHIFYIQNMTPEELKEIMTKDQEEVMHCSEYIGRQFDSWISNMSAKSLYLEAIRLKYDKQNYREFITLMAVALFLMGFTFIQLQKRIKMFSLQVQERKILEVVKASEHEFSTAFEYAFIGMALVGTNGQWLRVNKSLCNMLGYSADELLKLTFQDITHPDDLHSDLAYLQLLINDEIATYQMEKRYFTKEGEVFWINLSVSKVTHPDGSIKHFISQIENINERKKAEQLLAFSEKRFKGIFNSTFHFIGFLSPDGTLLEVNDTALSFAALKPEDVVGKKFWDCYWWQISPEMQEQLKLNIEKAAKGEFIQYEVENLGVGHIPVTVLFNLKPLLDDGGKVMAIISEGRPIQDMVDARKALMQKNEELERFASIASHDLKEPLRMIHSFMQLLEKNYAQQLDTTAKKYIAFAVDGSKRMTILINDLLTYAKVGSDGAAKEMICTNDLLEEIISLQRAVMEEKQAIIEIGPLPDIYGIRTPVKLLFQNLVANAIKYHAAGAKPRVQITARGTHGYNEFAVKDNGIGIPKESFNKIFQLFKRLHNNQEYAGAGMGLATCKKIVEQHGGQIWVESEEGKGSTFYFTI